MCVFVCLCVCASVTMVARAHWCRFMTTFILGDMQFPAMFIMMSELCAGSCCSLFVVASWWVVFHKCFSRGAFFSVHARSV